MIAYRSPLGRIRCYDEHGRVTIAFEPGPEADAAWESLPEVPKYRDAKWVDRLIEKQRASTAPEEETTMAEKNTTMKPKRARRTTKAQLIEERLAQVLDEIEKAQASVAEACLTEHPPCVDRIADHLAKAMVIGNGGDLLAWYRERVGV